MRDDVREGGSTGETVEGSGAIGFFVGAGVNGSLFKSGKLEGSRFESPVWKFMDLTKTT